jgi:hypothetical protein
MRLKLTLSCQPNSVFGFEHHHDLRVAIYKIIQGVYPVFSNQLPDKDTICKCKKIRIVMGLGTLRCYDSLKRLGWGRAGVALLGVLSLILNGHGLGL